VAAPVKAGDKVLGVLTVAKPMSTVQPFVKRAEQAILIRGAWLLGLSALVGVIVTAWVVWSVRKLRQYALSVELGERLPAPKLHGELGELAKAMEGMQERLAGREHIENLVRALTHELKSPLTAIAGAAELLHDELPAKDRQAFSKQIQDQGVRLRVLVERLLELSKLEQRRSLDHRVELDVATCMRAAMAQAQARASQRGVRIHAAEIPKLCAMGEADLLQMALSNLLDNAVDFEPAGGEVTLSLHREGKLAVMRVRDHGAGVPDYALSRLGERFFAMPRPSDALNTEPRKGSGLGLAIVRQIMALHGGSVHFAPAQPGLQVELHLPLR
jgi:two-component system, OmpR family, sensor histidine kinase CreC